MRREVSWACSVASNSCDAQRDAASLARARVPGQFAGAAERGARTGWTVDLPFGVAEPDIRHRQVGIEPERLMKRPGRLNPDIGMKVGRVLDRRTPGRPSISVETRSCAAPRPSRSVSGRSRSSDGTSAGPCACAEGACENAISGTRARARRTSAPRARAGRVIRVRHRHRRRDAESMRKADDRHGARFKAFRYSTIRFTSSSLTRSAEIGGIWPMPSRTIPGPRRTPSRAGRATVRHHRGPPDRGTPGTCERTRLSPDPLVRERPLMLRHRTGAERWPRVGGESCVERIGHFETTTECTEPRTACSAR